MSFNIKDGKGRGFLAEVNSNNELIVRAIVEPELESSSEEGKAFSWDSTELDIDAGDTMLFVKNTGDDELHFSYALVNGSNVICTWTVLLGATTTTPAGTAVTGIPQNEIFSSKTADVNSLSDETAVADGSIIRRIKTPVSNSIIVPLEGVILGKDHYVQVNQITESTSGSVILVGHFGD